MTKSDQLEPSTAERHVSNDVGGMKNNQYIAKLRDCVVEKIMRENRTTSSFLSDDHDQLTRLVEQRIMNMFSDFHTPDHPTYAFMIRRAVTELNDECRTDKESISEFIRKEYDDLPVAHESVLMFQLNNLCEKGEILLSAVGCYLLPVGDYFQQKKENGPERIEKKGYGGGESGIKGGNFKGSGAVVGTCEGEVCSRQMNGRKRKSKEGLRTRSRWSSRLQSYKLQVDEAKKEGSAIVEDITRSFKPGGENSTSGYQKGHIELPIADHRRDQHIEIFEDPFEPPGFPSKKDQLILQKQSGATDLPAYEIGAGVEQSQEENNNMKFNTPQRFDGGNISGFREHDLIKPSCEEPLQLGTGPNAIIEDAQNIQLQTPATALDNDSLRPEDIDVVDLHDNRSSEISDVVLLPGEHGKPAADDRVLILNQTTGVELTTPRKEEVAGSSQCQGLWTCTDNVPDQPVLNATLEMAVKDQQTFRNEAVTTPANSTPDTCPAALLDSQPDDDQHLKKQDTPMRRGRGRPPKTSNGFPITNEKPKKKDGRGRPRKEIKSDDLPEPPTDAEVEKTSKKKIADSGDMEVDGTKDMQQNSNSNSVNVYILALKCTSQDKQGTNKRKRVERPSIIDKDETSETMDFSEAKKGRGKGIKKSYFTDIGITDLIYSQDHLLQPMTRVRGRPRKL